MSSDGYPVQKEDGNRIPQVPAYAADHHCTCHGSAAVIHAIHPQTAGNPSGSSQTGYMVFVQELCHRYASNSSQFLHSIHFLLRLPGQILFSVPDVLLPAVSDDP